MYSEHILSSKGITPDPYPADAVFGQFIGTYSQDRQTVCIMAEDNPETLSIDKETVKEIAYTARTLITNLGCDIHSHTLKTANPFKGLKIERA